MNTVKFEVYTAKDNSERWRLVAGNGEIIATSEGYTTRQSALRSVQNVKDLVPRATVVELN